MADASQKVQQIINDNAVVVFSKSYCPYCRSSKQTLTRLGAEFETVELDQINDGSALQDALEELTNQRTVPNIFISQKSIGGNSDLQTLYQSGKLESLLKGATAKTA
ncbi:Fc.00g074530.m01.CDS01 [Cosmosporella sp. VM-42]